MCNRHIPAEGQMRKSMRSQHFNYLELTVVLTIIIVAVVLAFPLIIKSQEKNYRKVCCNKLKQIGLAIRMYEMDYKNYYPAGGKTSSGNFEILRSEEYLNYMQYICPSSKDSLAVSGKLKPGHLSYTYQEGLRHSYGDPEDDSLCDSAIASDNGDPSNHNKFGHFLYPDGHVTGYSGADWANYSGNTVSGWSAKHLPKVD